MQKNKRIIVVKIGTAVLTDASGRLNAEFLKSFCFQASKLIKSGYKIIVVTSGAIGAGLQSAGISKRPQALSKLQAAAAIGQNKLMKQYDDCMHKNNLQVAQILLTQEDFNNRTRCLNAYNTLMELLCEFNAVPIINENDTVATDEIKFGDNDRLSALVANLINAQQLIILTSVDGLICPDDNKVVHLVTHITASVLNMATKEVGKMSRGGMRSKLQAVKIATDSGVACVIANGRQKDILLRVVAGEAIGTTFLPQQKTHTGKKRWLAFFPIPCGTIFVDEGARQALISGGKSLLATGIKKIEGNFAVSDIVKIKTLQGEEFARGVTNYASRELLKIKGLKTEQFKTALNREIVHEEVVHRDNMAIL